MGKITVLLKTPENDAESAPDFDGKCVLAARATPGKEGKKTFDHRRPTNKNIPEVFDFSPKCLNNP